jgi:hypothetical protein
MAQEIKVA